MIDDAAISGSHQGPHVPVDAQLRPALGRQLRGGQGLAQEGASVRAGKRGPQVDPDGPRGPLVQGEGQAPGDASGDLAEAKKRKPRREPRDVRVAKALRMLEEHLEEMRPAFDRMMSSPECEAIRTSWDTERTFPDFTSRPDFNLAAWNHRRPAHVARLDEEIDEHCAELRRRRHRRGHLRSRGVQRDVDVRDWRQRKQEAGAFKQWGDLVLMLLEAEDWEP